MLQRLVWTLLVACIWPLSVAAAEPLELKLSVDYSDDDNVYRVPDNYGALGIGLPPGASRSDQITTATAEVQSELNLWRQVFNIELRGDAERFANNNDLDNEGGLAALRWRWRSEHAISGEFGARYERSLADFTNNRVLAKDMLDVASYWANLQVILRGNWALVSSLHHSETSNSNELREPDDNRVDSVTTGFEYRAENEDVYGIEYRFSNANYDDIASSTFDRDYSDDTALVRMSRALGSSFKLNAKAGWVWRDYPNAPAANYDGGIWRGALEYELGAKTLVELSTWRELRAYLSSESDYYEALGVGATGTWKPTERIRLGLKLSREQQDYLGVDSLTAVAGRDDDVDAAEFTTGYAFRDWLEFEAGYSAESHSSNRPRFEYDDRIVKVCVKARW